MDHIFVFHSLVLGAWNLNEQKCESEYRNEVAFSPALFNELMTSLPQRLPSDIQCSIYADDVCILTSTSPTRAIQHSLEAGLTAVNNFLLESCPSTEKPTMLPFSLNGLKDFKLYIDNHPL